MKKNCIIGQSGGPTAVINASLCGAAQCAMASEEIGVVYGALHGILGVLNRQLIQMDQVLTDQRAAHMLCTTPAAYLGSCRYKLPEGDDPVYETIFQVFKEYNIGYFFYIGGNDSMDTVWKLDRYAKAHGHDIRILGIPKTIDNDLLDTDHTPGFGSAAKYIASTVRTIGLDSAVYAVKSVTIVEIMGRNAGWLTAASALARGDGCSAPHLIYLPEVPFSNEQFIRDILSCNQRGIQNVIVAVSEGIRYEDGSYVCESMSSGQVDIFGHKYLSGTGKVLEQLVTARLGHKSRGIELSIPQRSAAFLASATDVAEAHQIGEEAVKAALSGASGRVMVFHRISDAPYQVEILSKEIEQIANGERMVPRSWIHPDGNDVTQEFLSYALPLIQGESYPVYHQGVAQYLTRQKEESSC